jgi:hypothetical protein
MEAARCDRPGGTTSAMEHHVIMRFPLLVLLCLVLAVAAGCSKRHRIQIETDTCWNGNVNGDQNINGCGNTSYRIIGTLRCVRVQKETSTGYLRLRIDERAWVDTPDQFGFVQVCN